MMRPVKKLIYTAICAALCVVLPMAFHMFPNGGQIFLPMHIPVLLCALVCGWGYGGVCGLLGPLLSSLLTSMPASAALPGMMTECCVYGLVAGLMMGLVRTGNHTADLYISLPVAMLAGRAIAGFVKAWILAPGTPVFAWVSTSLVTGLPGIVLQLALIPLLILALTRAKLLPHRYT